MKPSIPKGTRDFGPQEMLRRKYIFSTIEKVFQKYGFLPLETPAMENLETLTGKYGEEGDRLIFKVLKRGAELERALEDRSKGLAAEALRYDLTVPFARYVVMNQHELAFPFKRYQIQPVWRADRPQKGRYREFYQCDADVIGSNSEYNEVELTLMLIEVFEQFGLQVQIMLNDRRLLQGLMQYFGIEGKLIPFVTILDKYDKVGFGVIEEYRNAGYSDASIKMIESFLASLASTKDVHELSEELSSKFQAQGAEVGVQGIQSLRRIMNATSLALGRPVNNVAINFALARGLDYYTGAIFEVKAMEGSLQSSISGGGRYDDLTGVFGLKGMSGVGISFGADRIYDVLLETNKFPAELGGSTKVLFAHFGEAEALHCLKLLRQVRDAGIAAELYPDKAKMAKQFKYADDKGIPYVAILGENELKQGLITVKDMKSGEQKAVRQEELVGWLSSTIAGSK